ncbi:hypothetical protein ACFL1S_03005 [Pseudomonadota bacterium]
MEKVEIMFVKDNFVQDCIDAVSEGQAAVREIVTNAVSNPVEIVAELGEPEHAGVFPLHIPGTVYSGDSITI